MRLDEKRSISECDGKYDGERLYRCKAGFGIFVRIEDVKALEEDDDGDDWEPLPGPAGSTIGGAYDPVDALHHVVGHSSAKDKIQAVVNALEVNKRRVAAGGRAEPAPHMVLVGNPGCGKSMLARLVAYIVSECDVSRHGPLIRPSRTDLVAVGRSPGRTAEQVAQQCEKAEGAEIELPEAKSAGSDERSGERKTFAFAQMGYKQHKTLAHMANLTLDFNSAPTTSDKGKEKEAPSGVCAPRCILVLLHGGVPPTKKTGEKSRG